VNFVKEKPLSSFVLENDLKLVFKKFMSSKLKKPYFSELVKPLKMNKPIIIPVTAG